jgi:hypothetical protein
MIDIKLNFAKISSRLTLYDLFLHEEISNPLQREFV